MDISSNKPAARRFMSGLDIPNRAFVVNGDSSTKGEAVFLDRGVQDAKGGRASVISGQSQCKTCRVIFLLLPGYSMISLSSAIGVLKMANELGQAAHYEWQMASIGERDVIESSGLDVTVQQSFIHLDINSIDLLMICGGDRVNADGWHEKYLGLTDKMNRRLNQIAGQGIALGALGSGVLTLARCHLLDGYQSAVHWEYLISLRETCPQVLAKPTLYMIDRDRYTCCGGSSSLDLMLEIVTRKQSHDLASSISELLACERIRGPQELQRAPLSVRWGNINPR